MNEKELTIEEIHDCTLVILRKIIEICEKINIDYYMAYGSLLGTVRHNGFIPWDDDMDLWMMRKDFEQFTSYCKSHEKELLPFKLLSLDVDERYPYPIPRFSDTSYELKTKTFTYDKFGVYIDLYPLDGGGKEGEIEQIRKKYRFLSRCVFHSIRPGDFPYPKGVKKMVGNVVDYVLGREVIRRKILFCLLGLKDRFPIEKSKYLSCITWETFPPYKKEWFESYVMHNFEGLKVKIPCGYKEILKAKYGDYMRLPPEDMRHPTHAYSIYKK